MLLEEERALEKKELLEIEAREEKQAIKNVKEMARTKKMSDICLLYRDKFDLEDKKVLFSGHKAVSQQHLVPICDKVLFTIVPMATADAFENYYGFSVEQVVEWRKKGWIETVLSNTHGKYANLQYLDQLIEVSPSRSTRDSEYIAVLAGGYDRHNELISKGETLFKNLRAPDSMRSSLGERSDDLYLKMAAASYVDLSIFGLTPITDLAEEIIRKDAKSLSKVAWIVVLSAVYLTSPFTCALRKTVVYPSEEKSQLEMFHRIAEPYVDVFFAPCWLADVYKNLGMTAPDRMDTNEIEAVRGHSKDFVQAVKSLDEEIDKAVRERFQGGELNKSDKEIIRAKKEELRKRWFEDVASAFEDLSKREHYWSIGMTGSIIAPALALPAFTGVLGVPPAIAALAGAKKIKELVDPAAEFLSTFFECNPIHLGFYKVHKELEKVKKKKEAL